MDVDPIAMKSDIESRIRRLESELDMNGVIHTGAIVRNARSGERARS